MASISQLTVVLTQLRFVNISVPLKNVEPFSKWDDPLNVWVQTRVEW